MNKAVSTRTQDRKDQQNESGRRCRRENEKISRDVINQFCENDTKLRKLEAAVGNISRKLQNNDQQ